MKRLNVDRARNLRSAQTDAERALWLRLRDRLLLGRKFRRQHEIGPFVVDFVCIDAMLVVELHGGQHVDHAVKDAARSDWLQRAGYRVLRFWNDDVLKSMDLVLEQIVKVLEDTPLHPGPLRGGERDTGAASCSGALSVKEKETSAHTPPHPGPLPGGERETGAALLDGGERETGAALLDGGERETGAGLLGVGERKSRAAASERGSAGALNTPSPFRGEGWGEGASSTRSKGRQT